MKTFIQFFKRCNLAILLFTGLIFTNQSIGQGVVVNSTSPFVVPVSVTSLKVECWGAGGNGGGATGSYIYYFITTGLPLPVPNSYQASPTFKGLGPGQYQIRVIDNNRCESKSVQ